MRPKKRNPKPSGRRLETSPAGPEKPIESLTTETQTTDKPTVVIDDVDFKKLVTYWDSTTDCLKQRFLNVMFADLIGYLLQGRQQLAVDFLREAISFEAANSKSNCCSATHFDATTHENLRAFIPQLQEALLNNVRPEFFAKKWEAMDIPSTLKTLRRIKDSGSQDGIFSHHQWRVSRDKERTRLIDEILSAFRRLALRNCLSYTLIEDLMLYAIDEIQETPFPASATEPPGCQFEYFGFLMGILGAPQLKKIHELLQGISNSCPGARIKVGQESKDLDVLDVKLSLQLQDPHSFTGSYLVKFGSSDANEGYLPDGDTLIGWLFSNSLDEDLHESSEIVTTIEILMTIDEKFNLLLGMFEAKLILLRRKASILDSENSAPDSKPLSRHPKAVLKKDSDNHHQMEGMVNFFTGSDRCDSPSTALILDELDKSIEAVIISEGEEHLAIKLHMIDAKITQNLNEMADLELRLGAASASMYHPVLIHFMKPLMIALIQVLAQNQCVTNEGAAHRQQPQKKPKNLRK